MNDIINKPTPSINRTFLATLMTGINTAPRVLNIGNSSLNAKFESLESKQCGEIIAMKLYFIDELRSLKDETTINQKLGCNINIKETTTLKNKIKPLEPENNEVTNKQEFIDTLLQHYWNSVKTLILVVISLLQMKQGSNHMKGSITRKKIPSWIIDKKKKKINQTRKVMKKKEVTKKNMNH